MRRALRLAYLGSAAASISLLVAGCGFDTGGNHCDDAVIFRANPETGRCMPIQPDYQCAVGYDDAPSAAESGTTKRAPQESATEPAPWQGWQSCDNPCAGLDENSCSSDPSCTPEYDSAGDCAVDLPKPLPVDVDGGIGNSYPSVPPSACTRHYAGCKPVPVIPDRCMGLSFDRCEATPGCRPLFGGVPCACDDPNGMCACPAIAQYVGCVVDEDPPPVGCTSDNDCGGGSHCSTSDGDCRPPAGCGPGQACPAVCTGICVPDAGCASDADCLPSETCQDSGLWCPTPLPGMGGGSGGSGGSMTDPSQPPVPPIMTGCGQCVPRTTPGHCYDPNTDELWCRSLPPTCPTGTTAGFDNHCWTGSCIPNSMCAPVSNRCEDVRDERTCIGRPECEPSYEGGRCFCDASGCGCLEYRFNGCHTRTTMPPPPPPPPPPMCDPTTTGVRDIIGSFSNNDPAPYPRTYEFAADGSFTVSDAVAPCPPGAACVWSGIVTNRGRWTLSAGMLPLVQLTYALPMQTAGNGLQFPTNLSVKGCGANTVLAEQSTSTGRIFTRGATTTMP